MPRAKTQPRKLPTQARAHDTVEAILAAARRVLVKEGYEKTTTNLVADVAGVSIGSLYQYFPSKAALVSALIERHMTKMLEVLATNAAAGDTATIAEASRTVIRAVFAAHRVNPKLHRVLMEQMAQLGTPQSIDHFEAETQRLVEEFLKSHHPELRPRNAKLAARVCLLAVRGTTLWTVMRAPEQLEDSDFIEELGDMVVRYLVA